MQLVDGAMHASERGATLIRRLLAFSRRQTLSPRAVDLNDLLRSTVDLMRRAVGARMQLDTDLAADLWSCTADAAQLETARAEPGHQRPRRDGRRRQPGVPHRATCTCRATENGTTAAARPTSASTWPTPAPGIPPEMRDRIFEPFFSTKAPGRGTGPGPQHGVRLRQAVERPDPGAERDGQGHHLQPVFPQDQREGAHRARVRQPEMAPRARNETILLVEDDVEVRVMIQRLLGELGYRVVSTEQRPGGAGHGERGAEAGSVVERRRAARRAPAASSWRRRSAPACPRVRLLFTSGYAQDLVARRPESVANAPCCTSPSTAPSWPITCAARWTSPDLALRGRSRAAQPRFRGPYF